MHLLIPAAGVGRRMGSDRNKLLLRLLGQPILAWTLLAAAAAENIRWIGVIAQPSDFPDFENILAALKLSQPVEMIRGGQTRQESVYRGLQALPSTAERVLIHDGARCLITPRLFNHCASALYKCQGLIAAIPVKDTIKVVERDMVQKTLIRDQLWAAQTPQGFEVELLKQCHKRGQQLGWQVTDDAALFEECQLPVQIVLGEETNLKITTPTDLAIAESILRQRPQEENMTGDYEIRT